MSLSRDVIIIMLSARTYARTEVDELPAIKIYHPITNPDAEARRQIEIGSSRQKTRKEAEGGGQEGLNRESRVEDSI